MVNWFYSLKGKKKNNDLYSNISEPHHLGYFKNCVTLNLKNVLEMNDALYKPVAKERGRQGGTP